MPTTQILVVENNPMDVELLRIAFHYAPEWKVQMTVVEDGDEAINYLNSNSIKPDLVILDLNLPKRSGIDVLRMIRTSPVFLKLPVIVFSSSPRDAIRGRLRDTRLLANGYVLKPSELEAYYGLAKQFRQCFDNAHFPD